MTTLALTFVLAATFARPMERVSTMEPAQCRSLYDSHAIQLVYETPLNIDYIARPYRLTAGYCTLPEVSADGRVYRLRALHGPADAVKTALEKLRDPKVVTPNGWIVKDIDTITTSPDQTIEITLRRPVAYFPWLLAMTATAIVLPDGTGTGPYRLTHWHKNHEMVFTRRTPPSPTSRVFDTLRYLVIDDQSTQWLMFLKGEIDLLGEIARDNWDSVIGADGELLPALAARGIRLHKTPSLDAMYLGFNMRDPVVGRNKALRQALNAAFDFPAWQKFYNGRILKSTGPVPNGVGIDSRLETPFAYDFDLARAKALLAQAGYPNGTDPVTGRRLTLTLSIGRASRESREAGELTASFYAKLGIRLELEFMTWTAFVKAVNEARVQMFQMGWVGDYPHVQNFLQLFHSANVSPGVNHANYVNAEFDAAYDREDWARCQEIVREDCPWVFTHYNIAYSLTGPRVENYKPSIFSNGNEQYYENAVH